jgi:hypothetical protein
MTTSNSPPDLVSQLIRRGLPVEYAQRAAAEIADHHRDLIDELQAAGISQSQAASEASHRLGDQRTLIKKTVREYQRRHWCGRWPLLTFLIAPIPFTTLTWFTTMLIAGLCIIFPLYLLGVNVNPAHDGIVSTTEYLGNLAYRIWNFFLLPAVVLFALARWSHRAAMGSAWIVLSAVVLAIFVGLWTSEFPDPIRVLERQAVADEPLVVISLPIDSLAATWNWYTRNPLQICQWVLPLGFAILLLFRGRQLALRREKLVFDDC